MAKKTTSRSGTRKKTKSAASKAGSSRSAARKRTTSKARSGTGKTSARKTTKKPATKKKKKKKTVAKKKTAAKKTAAKKKTAPRKKTGSKKTSRKKTAASKASARKTSPRKTTSRKKTASKSGSGSSSTASSGKKKTTSKAGSKKTATARGGKRGEDKSRHGARSVAEVASSSGADDQGYVFINGRRVRMITPRTKPARPRAAAEPKIAQTVDDSSLPKQLKSPLTSKQLRHYRNLLLIKRAELVGDLSSLETEALRSSGGDLSHMPIHMADIGSDTYEQDFMLGLAENERKVLRDIDEALARIENGTYGVCLMTGEIIPEARLEAKPWAKYTVEAARMLERGWSA